MTQEKFIGGKLDLLTQDKLPIFKDIAAPLTAMINKGEADKIVKIPSDNN